MRSHARGLQSIIKICGLEGHKITIDDIVFKIGPASTPPAAWPWTGRRTCRLRRADTPRSTCSWSATKTSPTKFGIFIDSSNQARKSIDRSVTQEAHDYIRSHPEYAMMKSTVIYNPKWMKGIVGIVASRLIETYYRPTVVLTMSNGFVTGSARSVPGFDLYQAVESCADLLENFGGHMYAAGLTMKPENIEAFMHRFNEYVEQNIDPNMLIPQVEIDSELLFSDITPSFRATLEAFQPFGPGNTAPVFVTRGVSNRGDAKLVGAEKEHLRMDLTQKQKPNTTIAAIAFQQPAYLEWIRSGRPVDVCYTVVENHYRGENDAPATHQGHQDSPLRPGRQRPTRIRNRRGPAEYVRRASPANIAIRMPSTPRVATPLFVSIRRQALPSSRSGLIPAVRKVKKRAVR